jgi:hypothetical protein
MTMLNTMGSIAACLAMYNMWNERRCRAEVQAFPRCAWGWIAWCREVGRSWKMIYNMQTEVGKRQAVVEQRLKELGLRRWTDVDEDDDSEAEVWLGEERERQNRIPTRN